MSHVTHLASRGSGRARLVAAAVPLVLVVLALAWIGRAGADEGAPGKPDVIGKAFSNIATGKADAVDASADTPCTSSSTFADIPGMSETFSFGGNPSRPVLVLFQGEWGAFADGAQPLIRLAIDGVPQSGPGGTLVADMRPAGDSHAIGTRGFNFISDALAPGTHTAAIQWRSTSAGLQVCVNDRSLIVFHK